MCRNAREYLLAAYALLVGEAYRLLIERYEGVADADIEQCIFAREEASCDYSLGNATSEPYPILAPTALAVGGIAVSLARKEKNDGACLDVLSWYRLRLEETATLVDIDHLKLIQHTAVLRLEIVAVGVLLHGRILLVWIDRLSANGGDNKSPVPITRRDGQIFERITVELSHVVSNLKGIISFLKFKVSKYILKFAIVKIKKQRSFMEIYNFLAFDLGATSGRSVVGTLRDGKIEIRELTRFPNRMLELHGKYYWNLLGLYEHLKDGLMACAKQGVAINSIGVDTWGVDVVPIGADGSILGMPRAYRDPYTDDAPESYFEIISREEVYRKTGIQVMNFNTLYQIYAAVREGYTPIVKAEKLLFMPDALSYMLTGKAICEYTIASTSQILNPRTKSWDGALLEATGVRGDILPTPILPGSIIGELNEALAEECRIGRVPVVAVAGHDTASAVAAVPAEGERFAYLSSGTWSLMGIETREPIITEESFRHNFTNEGGVDGTTRFLKNICGMWILEQCRKEWEREGKEYSYPEIVEMASSAEPFVAFINPDDASFANPHSMLQAIEKFCIRTGQVPPQSDGQVVRTIFESLALRYREVLEVLESMSPFAIDVLHIIGGGSKNRLLNQYTANAIGKRVVAGPSEATAIGNVMMQAVGAGVVGTLAEARQIIRSSITTEQFEPRDVEAWSAAYEKFHNLK